MKLIPSWLDKRPKDSSSKSSKRQMTSICLLNSLNKYLQRKQSTSPQRKLPSLQSDLSLRNRTRQCTTSKQMSLKWLETSQPGSLSTPSLRLQNMFPRDKRQSLLSNQR